MRARAGAQRAGLSSDGSAAGTQSAASPLYGCAARRHLERRHEIKPVCYAASSKGRRLSDSGKSPLICKDRDSGKAGVSFMISFPLKGFVVVAGLIGLAD